MVLIHTFRDTISRFLPLQFLLNPKACLEPSQLSMIAYFAKTINGWKLSTIFTKYSVIDIWLVPDTVKISFSSTTTKKDVTQDLLKDLKKYTDSNHFLILSNGRFLRKIYCNVFRCGGFGTAICMNPLFRDVWILSFSLLLFWVIFCFVHISSAKGRNNLLLFKKNLKK